MRHSLRNLIVVTVIAVVVAAGYDGYELLFGTGMVKYRETVLTEGGEFFGTSTMILFSILYGRTLLRLFLEGVAARPPLVVRGENINERLQQFKLLLNKYHPHVGVVAIAAIFAHGLLMTRLHTNLLLYVVLALAVWQGSFGTFLKLRATPGVVRRKLYPAHAQLYTGIGILVFATFGHLLYS